MQRRILMLSSEGKEFIVVATRDMLLCWQALGERLMLAKPCAKVGFKCHVTMVLTSNVIRALLNNEFCS